MLLLGGLPLRPTEQQPQRDSVVDGESKCSAVNIIDRLNAAILQAMCTEQSDRASEGSRGIAMVV